MTAWVAAWVYAAVVPNYGSEGPGLVALQSTLLAAGALAAAAADRIRRWKT